MKRIGYLYDKICDMDNLRLAHKNARRGKGWYKEVKLVDADTDRYLEALQKSLLNRTFRTSAYQSFIRHEKDKDRRIYKLPYYPDRICQWAIMQIIAPYLLRRLPKNTYSAIPDRGIHKALYDMQDEIWHDLLGSQYCLKLDIHHYYPSINHALLKQQYRRIFKDNDLLWLLDEIIDSISTNEDGLTETGVPIGNYLSQWSGNVYLIPFDHWIKQRVKHYFRYMDDIVILHSDKTYLHGLYGEIREYLYKNLRLQIKGNWQVFPTFTRGIDFVGYRTFCWYTLLRKSCYKTMRKRLMRYMKKDKLSYHDVCSVNSYDGWITHCDGYRLRHKYILPLLGKAA